MNIFGEKDLYSWLQVLGTRSFIYIKKYMIVAVVVDYSFSVAKSSLVPIAS